MMNERKRKRIAREYLRSLHENLTFELWRDYKAMKDEEARSFVIFGWFPYVKEPFIAVGETKEEAYELVELCACERSKKYGLCEVVPYKGYWIVFDKL